MKYSVTSLPNYLPEILLVVFFSGVMILNGYSQINFAYYFTYDAGSDPQVTGIGDFNNDGLNDVVVGTDHYNTPETDHKLLVFLQDKAGQLAKPVIYPYSSYGAISSLVVDDMNNDHLDDIIIENNDSVSVFYQNTSHTLEKRLSFRPFYGRTNSLFTGDLNGDGLSDIAVTGYDKNYVMKIFYQNASGNFSFLSYNTPVNGIGNIKIKDMNNDNRNDVVGITGAGVHIYYQNNSGTLDNYKTIDRYPSSTKWHGFDVGDLNGDKLNDLVAAHYGNYPDAMIELLYNEPGTFNLINPLKYPAYDCPDPIRIENLNCDTKNEIIIAHGGWNGVTVFEQDNTGSYKNYTKFPIPSASHYNLYGMSVGDINNDGKKDIVIADYNHGLVVLINQSSSNSLVPKPPTPTGKSMICTDDEISSFKTRTAVEDISSWKLFPETSGTVLSTYKDSCRILWNNNWRGKAGLWVNVKNVCGERNSDTLYITNNRLPALNLGRDTTLCTNNSLSLSAGKGFTFYQWQDNSTDSALKINKGGIYSVRVGNECGNRYDTIRITEVPLPNIQIRDTFLCSGSPVQINAVTPGNNKYVWQDNSTDPFYTISTPGNYTLKITDANLCQNSKTIQVKEVPLPVVKLPNDTSLCKSDKLELDVLNAGCSYLWQDGTTSPHFVVEKDGTYSVTVSNECAKVNESVAVSFINCNTYLDVPTAFSPNGDNLNDVLYAVGTNVANVRFIIYNRWGQKVFESTSLDIGWDGTFQGRKLEPAVFIYYVSGTSTSDNQFIQKHGNVSLIR